MEEKSREQYGSVVDGIERFDGETNGQQWSSLSSCLEVGVAIGIGVERPYS
jgi:hypothetical protein